MRSIGGRVIGTGPWTSGMTSGIASKKSDMTVDSYASTRRGSQWSVARRRAHARNPLYLDAAKRGGDGAAKLSGYRIVTGSRVAPEIIFAGAGTDLRRDLYRRGAGVLVSNWRRRARRERVL